MRARVLGLIATPLLGYPAMAACLLLVDAWVGERFLSLYLRHEQRLLWDTFWSDYVAATPVMYALIGAVIGAFLLLRAFRSDIPVFSLVILFAGVGWMAAAYLTHTLTGATHVALVFSGALVSAPVAFLLAGLLSRRPEGGFG